mgnify:FL=1
MFSGVYHAAAGMRVREHLLDLTANNLANGAASGYRRDIPCFEITVPSRVQTAGAQPASLPYELVARTAVDLSPGPIRQTDNPLDLALDGPGFFAVQTPNGILYTRAGCFTRNANGQLVTQDGYPVLTDRGPVAIAGTSVRVDENGNITVDGTAVGKLLIAVFRPTAQFTKVGAGLLSASEQPDTNQNAPRVLQGFLEESNTNVINEMVNLIRAQRAYEAGHKVIQAFDDVLQRASSDIGRV